MQKTERSSLALSDASYCERETWDDWTRSSPSHSQADESELLSPPCGPIEDAETRALRAERDALARRLAAERARAAAQQRAQDARLAELHGVIAELVRRRAAERQRQAIPEEDASERSDECESTTQPAADIEDDQNECSSLPTPTEPASPRALHIHHCVPGHTAPDSDEPSSLCNSGSRSPDSRDRNDSPDRSDRSDRHARCGSPESGGSERLNARWRSSRPKLASRVRLRRAADNTDCDTDDEGRCTASARLALDAADAEDLQGALMDCAALRAALVAANARGSRLEADAAVLRAALARATDTAHRMSESCSYHESGAVSLCAALRAADRALEAYDVLLALAETQPGTEQRQSAERVARQLLVRLSNEHDGARLGDPLLPPGPWLLHDANADEGAPWSPEAEAALRAEAARLKRETAALRALHPPPKMFTYHDDEEEFPPLPPSPPAGNMADMEAAVQAQELCAAREERCMALAALAAERATSQRLARALAHLQKERGKWDRASETQL